MLSLVLTFALGLSPSMAGPPNAAVGTSEAFFDYTTSAYLTGPATAAQCTNAAVTTTEGGTITASRASTSYCQKDNGTYVLIDANKVVVEADGIRTEPASSNRVANSVDQNSTWDLTGGGTGVTLVTSSAADPLGGTTAQKWATAADGGYLFSPAFTITGTSAVLSAWVINEDLTNAALLILRDSTAGVNRCTITIPANTTSYATTMSGRPSCFSSAIVSGNNHIVRFFPGGLSAPGAGAIAWGVQVEPGITTKTSYIPTSGTAASRAADAITVTTADNSASGCVGATIKAAAPAFPQRLASRSGDVAAINATSQIFTADGTNTVFTGGGVSNITDRSVPWRVQWGGGSLSASLDTVGVGSGSFDGSMGSGTTLYIGSNSGVQNFHGWTKALKFSTSRTGCTP